MKLFYSLIFLVLSCSSLQKKMSVPLGRLELFPNGTYTHRVTITQKEMGKKTFNGVVKTSLDSIDVVGLSDFSTTVFSVHEDRKTKKNTTEVYVAQLKKHEARIKEFYGIIREFLHVKRGKQNAFPSSLNVKSNGKDVLIEFKTFDSNEVPSRIEISHPDFSVEVEVTSYDL